MRTVRPFERRVRTTDAGSIAGRTDVVTSDDELGTRIRIRGRLRLTEKCARSGRAGHRRAPRPRSRSSAVQERGPFRYATEPHQGTTQIALRGLVRRIRLYGADIKAPREFVVSLREQIRAHFTQRERVGGIRL